MTRTRIITFLIVALFLLLFIGLIDIADAACTNVSAPGSWVPASDLTCLTLDGANTKFDCVGYEINGNASIGLIIMNATNVTVTGCNVTNSSIGVYLYNATNVTISGGVIHGDKYAEGLAPAVMVALGVDVNISGNRFNVNDGLSPCLWDSAATRVSVYNNIFNCSYEVRGAPSGANMTFNVSNQSGTRITGSGNIGGNYYGQCTDNNYDGFCDTPHNLANVTGAASGYIDYLAYSMNYSSDALPPLVKIVWPEDSGTTAHAGITFKYNVSDTLPVAWCQLWDDFGGTWAADAGRNSTNITKLIVSEFAEKGAVSGTFTWATYCCDNKGQCNFSLNATFTNTIVGGVSPASSGGSSGSTTNINFLKINISAGEINNVMLYPLNTEWKFVITSQRELTQCECKNFTCSVTKTQFRVQKNMSGIVENELYYYVSDTCLVRDMSGSWATIPVKLHVLNAGIYYPMNVTLGNDAVAEDGKGIRYAAIITFFGIIYVGYRRGI